MLIGPMLSGDNGRGRLVEPPGIAPGSSPLITSAFISIVRASPNSPYIGLNAAGLKDTAPEFANGRADA